MADESSREVKIRTIREVIQGVPAAWHKIYDPYGPDYQFRHFSHTSVAAALDALDLDTCSVADITKVIGNDSWTENMCEECCEEQERVIVFERSDDYDTHEWAVCRGCLARATAIIRAGK